MLRSGLNKAHYRQFQLVNQSNVSRETFIEKIKF